MSGSSGDEPDDDEITGLGSAESEIQQMLGLFDAPAFARRGQDLEAALRRLETRCAGVRDAMLEMVRLRLRQWAAAAVGPEDWADTFDGPIAGLWSVAGADRDGPPRWADREATARRRRGAARDLIASVARFNRRWSKFVGGLDLAPVNRRIDGYNRYYVLEKECILGSHRLAARHFRPYEPLTVEGILDRHPLLPMPVLRNP